MNISPEEAQRRYEEAISTLPPEVQATLRALAASAKPRPRIDSLEESVLLALDPEDLQIAVIDFVSRALASSRNRPDSVLSMPRGLQIFYLSFVVEAEVMNGGFNQFFWNSSSEYAELVAPALRELGAPEAAVVFEQAFAVANEEVQTTGKIRNANTLEAFSESYDHTRLNEFDPEFCKLAAQFQALRQRVVRDNEPPFFPQSRGG